jgi:hypothetical protein
MRYELELNALITVRVEEGIIVAVLVVLNQTVNGKLNL